MRPALSRLVPGRSLLPTVAGCFESTLETRVFTNGIRCKFLADLGETRIVVGEVKTSEADLVRLREAYEAWNRGDVGFLLDQIAPEFELHDVDVPDSPVYRGREGLLANVERLDELFTEFAIEPRELLPLGDRILALVRIRVRGRGSDVPLEQDVGHLWTLRDGRAQRLEVYLDLGHAREAAGLTSE